MTASHKVVEEIFNNIVHALAQLASCATNDLKAALNENLGSLILWRGGFQTTELSEILEASMDINLAVLRNLYLIGGFILKLHRLGEFYSTYLNVLTQTRNTAREHIRLQASKRVSGMTNIEDDVEDEEVFSDDSENEVDTNIYSLKLHIKHLMRLTPTMERVLADAVSSRTLSRTNTLDAVADSSSQITSKHTGSSEGALQVKLPSYSHVVDSAHERSDSFTESLVKPFSTAKQVPTNIIAPIPPQMRNEWDFYELMSILANVPIHYDSPAFLDEALTLVPLDSIYTSAEEEHNLMKAMAESVSPDSRPEWGYQDAVAKSLLRWFKRQFFSFVNNPVCSSCGHSTIANGNVPPADEEKAKGATKVEIYYCSGCGFFERFPRYSNVWTLLKTRKGRQGEFANCFTMFCHAAGLRVRWVWSSEHLAWTEIYSGHQQRWIHVDATEEAWDRPEMYTKDWGRKLAYCIAFSVEGATDVTRRYVRNVDSQLRRSRVPENVLQWIILKLRKSRRERMDKESQFRLMREDELEERELSVYAAQSGVAAMLQSMSLTDQTESSTVRLSGLDPTTGEKRLTVSSDDTDLEVSRGSVTDQ